MPSVFFYFSKYLSNFGKAALNSKFLSRTFAKTEIVGPFKSAVITVPIPIPTNPPKRIRLRATLATRKTIS